MDTKSVDADIDIIIAYAQLAVYTLQNSGNEVTMNEIKHEIKMLHKKFGAKELVRLANIITKGKNR